MTVAETITPAVADDYLELVKRFPLVSIRDDEHLDAAYVLIDELSIIGEDALTPGQMDYLNALGDLTTVYEGDTSDMSAGVTGPDMVRFMAEQHDLTAADVGGLIGDSAVGEAIFDGRRPVTVADAAVFSARFHCSADLFLYGGRRPPHAAAAAVPSRERR